MQSGLRSASARVGPWGEGRRGPFQHERVASSRSVITSHGVRGPGDRRRCEAGLWRPGPSAAYARMSGSPPAAVVSGPYGSALPGVCLGTRLRRYCGRDAREAGGRQPRVDAGPVRGRPRGYEETQRPSVGDLRRVSSRSTATPGDVDPAAALRNRKQGPFWAGSGRLGRTREGEGGARRCPLESRGCSSLPTTTTSFIDGFSAGRRGYGV